MCREAATNANSVELIPKFGQGIARLKEIIYRIDELAMEQITDLKGITVEKKITGKELMEQAMEIAGAMHSYAQEKNDLVLLEIVNFPVSSWGRMNNHKLLVSAGIILTEVKKISDGILAEQGISAENIQQFEDLYDRYSKLKSAWREAVIDRSGYTAKIGELFREAHTLVTGSLDKLAMQYKRKDPDFYRQYKSSRHIIYRRSRKKNKGDEVEPED
jgi:hypothetical protein